MKAVNDEVWRRAQDGHFQTWRGYAEQGTRDSREREAYWRAILAALDTEAPIKPGERILDIGCGLDTVLDYLPGVSGYTLDSLMGRLSSLGLSQGILHAAGMIEHIPFRDASFDRVFLMNVLDHVQSPGAGLREIARVLRPGGTLVLSVDTYSGTRYWQKRAHKWWARVRGARTKHPWVFSRAATARALRAAGLEPGPPSHVEGTKARRTFLTANK